MNKRLLSLMASLLLCGAVSAQSHFEADTHAQDNNMPVVAQVVLDGQTVTTGGYELGAFVGTATEARGSAQIQPTLDNTYWIQVYYSTENESNATVTFKLYDGEDEYTAETTLTINPEGAGTPSDPVEIVVNRAVTQTTTLAAGWTWWSTPIEMNNNNGLEQLQNSISQYGVKIISQSGTRIKRPNGMWVGGFSALYNEQCYKINVSDISTLTMTGAWADPTNHVITLNGGEWNWIGYPVSVQQTANVALANLQPTNGDAIMGPEGSSIYRAGQWRPNINLIPGYGYMYNSKAASNTQKTFVYAVSRSTLPSEAQDKPYWIANTHKYENCMIVAAVVYIEDEEQRDETLELGAFVDGECTGTAKLFYIEEDDRYFAVLTIGGEEGDRISFGLVDETKGILYHESSNSLSFSKNAIVGDFDNPYEIHFDATGISENSMQVAMYPNPVDRGQSFKLNLPQEEDVLDVTIINALGTTVRHEKGALKSTIGGLPVAGVYTIKAVCRSGNTYYGRLIVK